MWEGFAIPMSQLDEDYRDSSTVWLHTPDGTVIELTREDLEYLRNQMDSQDEE